jgi:hypothetical protein
LPGAAAPSATIPSTASVVSGYSSQQQQQPNAFLLQGGVAAAAQMDHDTIVSSMAERTKQDKDVCYFYLESADWDLENAIELLKSMQGTAM